MDFTYDKEFMELKNGLKPVDYVYTNIISKNNYFLLKNTFIRTNAKTAFGIFVQQKLLL
jgi:hypothetical protein